MWRAATIVSLLILAAPASAAEVTATLALKNLFCAACSITVREAIANLPGVKSVTVDYRRKVAVVAFDDAVATIGMLAAASRDAGFPAEHRE